jgi:hypothetical protein
VGIQTGMSIDDVEHLWYCKKLFERNVKQDESKEQTEEENGFNKN